GAAFGASWAHVSGAGVRVRATPNSQARLSAAHALIRPGLISVDRDEVGIGELSLNGACRMAPTRDRNRPGSRHRGAAWWNSGGCWPKRRTWTRGDEDGLDQPVGNGES